jgi:hypothetical protein
MESVALPTFTIPTFKCGPLILTFDDISEILGSKPRIVQVGIGELERSQHLIDLGVNWLFSPAGWPVMASAYNPGIPEPEQTFQYESDSKRMQVANGTARAAKTYVELLASAKRMVQPSVSIVSLPCEEDANTETAAEVEKPVGKDSGKSKVKRKIARRNQSFTDSLLALSQIEWDNVSVVLPLIGSQQPLENVSEVKSVIGFTSRVERLAGAPEGLRFAQIRNVGSPEAILESIKAALGAKSDVMETDFPFFAAKNGLLLNENLELENMKDPAMFHNNDLLMNVEAKSMLVIQAGLHTKSYIHHLFRCEELSGPILLATVNLFQFERMFQTYRNI